MQKLVNGCDPFSNIIEKEKAEHEIFCLRIRNKDFSKILKELEDLGFIEKSNQRKLLVHKDKFKKYTSWF